MLDKSININCLNDEAFADFAVYLDMYTFVKQSLLYPLVVVKARVLFGEIGFSTSSTHRE